MKESDFIAASTLLTPENRFNAITPGSSDDRYSHNPNEQVLFDEQVQLTQETLATVYDDDVLKRPESLEVLNVNRIVPIEKRRFYTQSFCGLVGSDSQEILIPQTVFGIEFDCTNKIFLGNGFNSTPLGETLASSVLTGTQSISKNGATRWIKPEGVSSIWISSAYEGTEVKMILFFGSPSNDDLIKWC